MNFKNFKNFKKIEKMTALEFVQSLTSKVNAEAIIGHNTVFHFTIDGDGGGQKTVQIVEGKMEVLDGLVGTAKCVVTVKDDTLMKIVSGQENPMMAFMTGKIKVSNPGELMKYSKIFGLM
jgi:putative sterol carrier protein